MPKIAQVKLREGGAISSYYCQEDVAIGDIVIVEVDRGLDYGEVIELGEGPVSKSIMKVVRKATKEDLNKITLNKKKAIEAQAKCAAKIEEYQLEMKLVYTEYSFDQKKIIFYFTSEERVDFRELVKDLAKLFKTRIEMRQIGVRDEAKMFGGFGPCGRKLCCTTFLYHFEPVSMKMAKQQKMPLNPSKISGICGRLMCCLFYEYKHYREMAKGLPKEGQSINTAQGKGKVIAVNIIKREAIIQFEDGHIEKKQYPLEKNGKKDE